MKIIIEKNNYINVYKEIKFKRIADSSRFTQPNQYEGVITKVFFPDKNCNKLVEIIRLVKLNSEIEIEMIEYYHNGNMLQFLANKKMITNEVEKNKVGVEKLNAETNYYKIVADPSEFRKTNALHYYSRIISISRESQGVEQEIERIKKLNPGIPFQCIKFCPSTHQLQFTADYKIIINEAEKKEADNLRLKSRKEKEIENIICELIDEDITLPSECVTLSTIYQIALKKYYKSKGKERNSFEVNLNNFPGICQFDFKIYRRKSKKSNKLWMNFVERVNEEVKIDIATVYHDIKSNIWLDRISFWKVNEFDIVNASTFGMENKKRLMGQSQIFLSQINVKIDDCPQWLKEEIAIIYKNKRKSAQYQETLHSDIEDEVIYTTDSNDYYIEDDESSIYINDDGTGDSISAIMKYASDFYNLEDSYDVLEFSSDTIESFNAIVNGITYISRITTTNGSYILIEIDGGILGSKNILSTYHDYKELLDLLYSRINELGKSNISFSGFDSLPKDEKVINLEDGGQVKYLYLIKNELYDAIQKDNGFQRGRKRD